MNRMEEHRDSAMRLWMRAMLRASVLVLLFVFAGRLDWYRGWLLNGILIATFALGAILMEWKNPGLLRHRLEAQREGMKSHDRVFFYARLPLALAFIAVAGLDARFGWSKVAEAWVGVGIVLHALGTVPLTGAMMSNKFLEHSVRIQTERGHTAVSGGPYQFIRHPMYAGLLLMFAGWPMIVGSWMSYGPLILLGGAILIRTAYEDRALQNELPGYREYAAMTKYRLLPGVW